jgi:FkbH-like protein
VADVVAHDERVDDVRVVSRAAVGEHAELVTAYAERVGRAVRVLAPPAGDLVSQLDAVPADGAPVVVVVGVEDVFPELDAAGDTVPDVATIDALLRDAGKRVEAFAERLRDFVCTRGSRYVVVPPVVEAPVLPVAARSVATRLARLGSRITDAVVEALADLPGGSVVDVDAELRSLPRERWQGDAALSVRRPVCGPEAAALLARAVVPRLGLAWQAKVVVTDLDDTLWRGILSEDGVDAVGSRPVDGEIVHLAWQRLLLCARSHGFILAVVSKNSPNAFDAFADESLRTSAGLIVTPDDFAAVSTAWDAKSEQLAAMSVALDLPLDVFVLVDDNPVELAEVAAAHPAVRCLRFPTDGSGWPEFCRSLQELTATSDSPLTDEDRERARLYGMRYRAETARAAAPSMEEFLASLGMRAEIRPIGEGAAVARGQQLLNRANRFHLTGHRFDDAAWAALLADPDRDVLGARLTDCYGDHGVCAVAVTARADDGLRLLEMAMSCRVLNRALESAVLAYLARAAGGRLRTTWRSTGRNEMVLDMLRRNGFATLAEDGSTHELVLREEDALAWQSRFVEVVS